MKGEFDLKIDIMHALEDFLDAYDNHATMVVTEAIANAIDVDATKIDIVLKEDLDGKMAISFHNNGPAMTEKQFENYHVLARSGKSKGHGIGFAGIGAKVYLAAWAQTVIHTETSDGRTGYASDMYVKNKQLKATYVDPAMAKPGTLYRVLLEPDDFAYLEMNILDIIADTFTPAMSKIRITINGRAVDSWDPDYEFKKGFTARVKGKKFPSTLMVTKKPIQRHKMFIQYHVLGKTITTKKPDLIHDVKSRYSDKIHVYVDALEISDQLNLNKTNFKQGSGFVVSPVMKEVERHVANILKKEGYMGLPPMEQWEKNALTKFFEKIFTDPKYAFLNPNAIGGKGLGGEGRGTGGIGKTEGSEQEEDSQGKPENESGGEGSQGRQRDREKPDRTKSKPQKDGGGSFSIGWVERKDDPRDGWLDPSTRQVMVNIDHPLFRKYEKNVSARNQRIGVILTNILIKNASEKEMIDTADAFDLQSELLTLAKDVTW